MPNPWLNEHKSTAAMNYFLILCYDVTKTTGLLSRLHLQKQAVRLKITSAKKLWCIFQKFVKSVLEQFTSLCIQ